MRAWAGEATSAGVQIVDRRLAADGTESAGSAVPGDGHALDAAGRGCGRPSISWRPGLRPRANATYRRSRQEVSSLGDVAANLLKLQGTDFYPEQTVTLSPVSTEEGGAWTADPGAEILLLGDSFANIYSATNLNWGGSAGLAEQISYHLKRPAGSLGRKRCRCEGHPVALARALYRGDRLAGKKVVIWEFAARELAMGDWQHIDWDAIMIPDEVSIPVAAQSRPG